MKTLPLLVSLLFAALLFPQPAQADETIPAWVDQKYLLRHAEMMHKVRTLIIPKVDWKNVPFRTALEDIAYKSRLADPTHQGIHFMVDPRITHMAVLPVTYQGENKPLFEILKQLGSFGITDSDVYFEYNGGEGISSRAFYVPTGFFKIPAGNESNGAPDKYDVRDQLSAKGVKFSPGATAIYDPQIEKLCVIGKDSIEQVDELLNP
jgi:hypothetical protein